MRKLDPADEHDQAGAFLERSVLNFQPYDHPERIDSGRALLLESPALALENVWTAACAGAVDALEAFLDQDPGLVGARGGPLHWEPLLYATYSRLAVEGFSTLEAGRLLLERGADPNTHWMWGGQYRFTALTGVFGEGENGPVNAPPHPDCEAFARLLLEAGTHPNDSQALYNTMFTEGDRCLELLLEFGLGADAKNNWLEVDASGKLGPNPRQTLQYQLHWALNNYHTQRARLLIAHGADLGPFEAISAWKAAKLTGHLELLPDLLSAGAQEEDLSPVEAFAAACMAADRDQAISLLQADGDLPNKLITTFPSLLEDAAGADRRASVRCLVELGWDVNAMPGSTTALHQAAWSGRREMCELLIGLGADTRIRDLSYDAVPGGWAMYNGHPELAIFLRQFPTDIFASMYFDTKDAMKALLEEDPARVHLTFREVCGKREPRPRDWKTPLATAVEDELPKAIEMLMQYGADPSVKGPDGRSILEMAEQEHPELAGLLRR